MTPHSAMSGEKEGSNSGLPLILLHYPLGSDQRVASFREDTAVGELGMGELMKGVPSLFYWKLI